MKKSEYDALPTWKSFVDIGDKFRAMSGDKFLVCEVIGYHAGGKAVEIACEQIVRFEPGAVPIREQIKELEDKIKEIRSKCSHPNVTQTFGGTWSFDSSPDKHHVDHHCPDCGARWRIFT